MPVSKIVVFGKNGQLGDCLFNLWRDRGDVFFSSRADTDLEKQSEIRRLLDSEKPQWIINAAAYNDVNKAEVEREKALSVNALAPETMAQWCRENGAKLITFSTDYVFSGEGDSPWLEEHEPAPINFYGHTKREGEKKVISAAPQDSMIWRTSWVFYEKLNNFPRAIIKAATTEKELKVVDDHFGVPTYAKDLARSVASAIEFCESQKQFPAGIFHTRNNGQASRYEVAKKTLEYARSAGIELKVEKIIPIKSSEFISPVKRPLNSRLDNSKFQKTFGFKFPLWTESLKTALRLMNFG